MILKIENCNNIDSGLIEIEPERLNIKYAMNGTGKSTIAKAIELSLKKDGSLKTLTPFKFLVSGEKQPLVEGIDSVSTAEIFNDTYIGQFVFKEDEVLANSFEIFVRTPDYEKHLAAIEKLISDIKNTGSSPF